MAAAFVQGKAANATATSVAATFDSSVTTGNLIVVASTRPFWSTITSVTDNQGNTYTSIMSIPVGSASSVLYYAQNVTGGSVTVTVSGSGSADRGITIQEFSGIVTSSSLDKTASASGTSTAPDSGNTATTTQADELIVGVVNWNAVGSATASLGSGYTNLTQNASNGARSALQSKVVSSTGAYSSAMTLSASKAWTAGVATFKAAAAATTSTSSTSSSISTSSTSTSRSISTSSTSLSTSSTSSSISTSSTSASTSESTSSTSSSLSTSSTSSSISISTSSTSTSSTSTSRSTSTSVSTSSTSQSTSTSSTSTSISETTSTSSTSSSTSSTSSSTSTTVISIDVPIGGILKQTIPRITWRTVKPQTTVTRHR